MPNPLYPIRTWLEGYAERRGLRTQIEVADGKQHRLVYFVIGGKGVRDEVLTMRQADCQWWPIDISVRGGEWSTINDEAGLSGFLGKVE